jgi:hypothetical protein
MTNIFGFTLIRNGVQYDYPFVESIRSLQGVTEKVYIAVGESSDTTAAEVEKLSQLKPMVIIPTEWDEKLRSGGIILSQQTNIALDHLREKESQTPKSWGLYLQGDEVLHERDYALIREDFAKAEAQGCDAIRFRYLHFWQGHHAIAINKKWYPAEIRGVKLNSQVESWGDAQSFRKTNRIYDSEAIIYHYGHVRTPDQYQKKKADFLKLYHLENKLPKYRRREARYDRMTKVLDYWGPHPEIMRERILRLEQDVRQKIIPPAIAIIDRQRAIDAKFCARIEASSVQLVARFEDIDQSKNPLIFYSAPSPFGDYLKLWRPSHLKGLLRYARVPHAMYSPLARPWSPEFHLLLQLSAEKIQVRS